MAAEHGQSTEIDLDRTDRLPILAGVTFDDDVEDDAVRLEFSATLPTPAQVTGSAEFIRGSSIDLPSLAESVRSVEERIARQNADYDALHRSYEKARDAESAANLRLSVLEGDLAGTRAALEAEQARMRDHEKIVAERNELAESQRARTEERARERESFQAEVRTLRDSLATRDATIVQVLHSLGERDTQLTAVQQDHARNLSALESRSQTSGQLESELAASRANAASLDLQLKAIRGELLTATAQLRHAESNLNSTRSELAAVKTQGESYLELLRTRDWRSGFDQNMFRDMDAKIGAADSGRDVLEAERDRLHSQVSQLQTQIAARDVSIDELRAHAATHATMFAQQSYELKQAAESLTDFRSRLTSSETERSRLAAELAASSQALAQAKTTASAEVQRMTEMQRAAERRVQAQTEQSADLEMNHAAQIVLLKNEHHAQLSELKTEVASREDEMNVLVAHLQQARRPVEVIEAEAKRLRDELAAKSAAFDELSEEVRTLRATLERTRGALEEREFLIRRLERSESNNANALGRIQTSMERLGSVVSLPSQSAVGPAADGDLLGELLRLEGDRQIAHKLARRTRIGRAPGCEMQIDSSSVSRHHALILAGPREAIIEDLNSTNGVIVNGRKVTRHLLRDGDLIIIGEIQFKYAASGAKTAVAG